MKTKFSVESEFWEKNLKLFSFYLHQLKKAYNICFVT
jgi:hypothetical protein